MYLISHLKCWALTGWQFVMRSLEGHLTLLASFLACTFLQWQFNEGRSNFSFTWSIWLFYCLTSRIIGSFLKAQPCTRSQPAQTRYKQVWICRLTKSQSSKTVKVMKPNPLWLYLHTFYNISTMWPTPTYGWTLLPALTTSQINHFFSVGFYEVLSLVVPKYVALHFPLVGMNSTTYDFIKKCNSFFT